MIGIKVIFFILFILFVHAASVMAFPQPKPQAPQLPNHLLRTIDCQQGAIRAVRFNGEKTNFQSKY